MKLGFSEAKKVLGELISNVPAIHGMSFEEITDSYFVLHVHIGDSEVHSIAVSILQRAAPQTVTMWIQQNSHAGSNQILMAPYFSEASAQICKQNNIGFCDFSGNCHIAFECIYISQSGIPNKYPAENHAKTVFNASSEITSLILRELLNEPGKSWRIKELSETVGCSIGMVSRVKTYLCEQNWAVMDKDGLYIQSPEKMLREWSKSYHVDKTQIMPCYTIDSIPVFEEKCADAFRLHGIKNYLTGFSGGVRYSPAVRYAKAHLWVKPGDVDELLFQTNCKKVDSGANIHIFISDRRDVFSHSREIRGNLIVSPVQIWLDCMTLKGRGEEMAESVYKKEIIHGKR